MNLPNLFPVGRSTDGRASSRAGRSIPTAVGIAVLLAVALPAVAAPGKAGDTALAPVPIRLTPEQLAARQNAPIEPWDGRKGDSVLDEISDLALARKPWQDIARSRGLLVDGDRVLLELRLDPTASRSAVALLEGLGARIHTRSVPSVLETWVPASALAGLAALPGVLSVQQARLVEPAWRGRTLAGDVVSEGVAASGLGPYHDLGADGDGVVIAVIDQGFLNWASLQAAGEWPPAGRLRRFQVDGGTVTDCDTGSCPGFERTAHGAANLEIAYDAAPGATFLAYAVLTRGEWYAALLHASDAGANGVGVADVISASLSMPLDGVGDGSTCPPNWADPCGTIAEAAGTARARGSLVVNAAGNARLEHWGGLFSPHPSANWLHVWDGGTTWFNTIGDGPGRFWCIPDGAKISAQIFWADWEDVNIDYDLFLLEYSGSVFWYRAWSTDVQSGADGQNPQEILEFTASNASGTDCCGANSGCYAFRIERKSGLTQHRNLQFFYDVNVLFPLGAQQLGFFHPQRSLAFPSDSPNVVAVGALLVSDGSTQAVYSSEGPILGPGGSLAAPSHPKLNAMSFTNVSTVSYGASGFGGTSAATPHVAGVAAVLTQLRSEKPVVRGSQPAGLSRALELVGLNGDNDLGAPGHDTVFGYGRIRLRECQVGAGITAGWNMVSLPCDRRHENTPAGVFGSQLGALNTDWGLWRWNAGTNAYQRIYSDTEPLALGEGYWIYRFANAPGAAYQGLTADRSEAYPVALTGASGLGRPHAVGAPRSFSLPWNQVRFFYDGAEHTFQQAHAAGKIRNIMWTWNRASQQYEEFDGLLNEGMIEPGRGFWVRVLEDVEVRLPAEPASGPLGTPVDTGLPGPVFGWTVTLRLAGASTVATARLGHHPDAGDGFDRFDAEQLGAPGAIPLRIGFPHPEWGPHAGTFVRDIRASKGSDEWCIEISSQQGGTVTLLWDGPPWVLANSVLIDDATGKALPVNRFSREGYRFNISPGSHALRWRFGSSKAQDRE